MKALPDDTFVTWVHSAPLGTFEGLGKFDGVLKWSDDSGDTKHLRIVSSVKQIHCLWFKDTFNNKQCLQIGNLAVRHDLQVKMELGEDAWCNG